jgi:uncharacterized protein (TIGR02300 family)
MIEGGVMPKEEWGVKRVCPTTGKRFFDLNKTPVVSPYSGEVVNIDTGKGSRTLVADKPDKAATKAKAKPTTDDAVVENAETVVEEDEDIDLDDDLLDDDDDDDTVALDDIADVAADDDDS